MEVIVAHVRQHAAVEAMWAMYGLSCLRRLRIYEHPMVYVHCTQYIVSTTHHHTTQATAPGLLPGSDNTTGTADVCYYS